MSSKLDGANLTGANVRNANLTTSLESAIFDLTTVYNQGTRFPPDFNPFAAGLTLMPSPTGDSDADDSLDDGDLYPLVERILHEDDEDVEVHFRWLPEAMFDLNANGIPDQGDHRIWVQDLKKTWLGDANLDGAFNSLDLVQVFVAGRYEEGDDEHITSWAEGDWDGDGFFDSSDMVTAFVDGGYEKGPRAGVAVVPESGAWTLFVTTLLPWCLDRRTRRPI